MSPFLKKHIECYPSGFEGLGGRGGRGVLVSPPVVPPLSLLVVCVVG